MANFKIDFFVHPIALFPVALMAVNDHWLKYAYPGWFTGKLSDFAGIFYFPIFILAMVIFVFHVVLTRRNLWLAILFTDFLLMLVKLNEPAARWIETIFAQYLFRIQLIQDPTDLLALSMNALTYIYMKKYLTGAGEPAQSSLDK
ncbi:MAG TPA: hypothetical protein VIG33_14970 [Pseudobdellovibrionaceae bacterium]|jgi:hypothetical protein